MIIKFARLEFELFTKPSLALRQIMGISGKELSREVIIVNELGLHARSAGKIAKLAQNAKSTIWLIKDNEKVDASSIIDILTLACAKGSKIMLTVDSKPDIHILNEITALVKRGFEE